MSSRNLAYSQCGWQAGAGYHDCHCSGEKEKILLYFLFGFNVNNWFFTLLLL